MYPIEDMDSEDREWFLKRLTKQKKAEADAIKQKTRGKKGRR